MDCLHCGAPAQVVDQICIACAADATLRRNLFAEYRYLWPGEKITLGTEAREDRLAELWGRAALGEAVPDTSNALYRRKIRLDGDGRRYLDTGETLREGDLFTPPAEPPSWAPIEASRIGLKVDDSQAFTRAMYATFGVLGCSCATTRVPLIPDVPEPSICTKCSRVWNLLEAGSIPEATYPPGTKPDPDCRCTFVDPVPPSGSGSDELPPWEIPSRVQCQHCGQVWDRDAWQARNSKYPDLETRRINEDAFKDTTSPRQAEAIQRVMFRYEQVAWRRLRTRAARALGEEEAKKIDATFVEVEQLLNRRTTKEKDKEKLKDPQTLRDTDDVLKVLHDQLGEMDRVFKVEAASARAKRFEYLNMLLQQEGGKPFFHFSDLTVRAAVTPNQLAQDIIEKRHRNYKPGSVESVPELREEHGWHDEPASIAAIKTIGARLGPIVTRALYLPVGTKMEDTTALVNFIRVQGDALQHACEDVLKDEQTTADVKALAVELKERISHFEIVPAVQEELPAELVEAITPDMPKADPAKPRSATRNLGGTMYLVLHPDADDRPNEIRAGDYWEDHDVIPTLEENEVGWLSAVTKRPCKFRPCVSTVGKKVPWPAGVTTASAKELAETTTNAFSDRIMKGTHEPADREKHINATRAISPFRRMVAGDKLPESLLLPPDPYKEHQFYLRYAGLDPETNPLPIKDEVTVDVAWAGKVNLEDVERHLRRIYEAVGLNVRAFAIDQKLRVAHLVLLRDDGAEQSIAVPLPEGL